ncbi:MAG: hypothetical protein ACUVS3_14225 [Thermodesulfobacteriota bacterium]
MMRAIKTLFWVIAVAVVLTFVLQNGTVLTAPVEFKLNLFVKDLSPGVLPLYGFGLVSFLVGILLAGGWGALQQIKLRGRIREARRLLQEKDRELSSLRNLPVVEGPTSQGGQTSQGA